MKKFKMYRKEKDNLNSTNKNIEEKVSSVV